MGIYYENSGERDLSFTTERNNSERPKMFDDVYTKARRNAEGPTKKRFTKRERRRKLSLGKPAGTKRRNASKIHILTRIYTLLQVSEYKIIYYIKMSDS